MIEHATSLAHRLSRLLAWIGGGMLLAASAMITVDVLARRLFNVTLGGSDEITGYCFAVGTSLSLAFALFERAHIRIDAAYQFLPVKARTALDIFGLVALTGFTALIAYMAWGLVADTLHYNSKSITPLKVPLAIPQIPWLAGWLFAVIAGILLLVAAIGRIARDGAAAATPLIGIKTVDETIEDETGGAR